MTVSSERCSTHRDREPAVLRVENLSVEFLTGRGWTTAVDSVTFSIQKGETVCLVGESGSGKSVTCLAALGLIDHKSGRVTADALDIAGHDVKTLHRRQLEDLRGDVASMIFQEPMTSLNPAFTVGDQIMETIRRHRGGGRSSARRRAVEMLELVGIPNAARRVRAYPHEFSGGMRQRASIAMALSCEPELLIADEPTTALDVTIQAQILELLRDMRDEFSMSLLFITHDMGVVADISDRVLVMYAGEVVEEAQVHELFENPRHPYTDGLLRSMPSMAASTGELHTIAGSPPAVGAVLPGCRFAERCDFAERKCVDGPILLESVSEQHMARCVRSLELGLGADHG